MVRHEAQTIIASMNKAAVDRVARELHAVGGVRAELVAFVELEGVDAGGLQVQKMRLRVEERDHPGMREAVHAEEVLSETRVVDDVGEVKGAPSACGALEAHRTVTYKVALENVTISHANSNHTVRISSRK